MMSGMENLLSVRSSCPVGSKCSPFNRATSLYSHSLRFQASLRPNVGISLLPFPDLSLKSHNQGSQSTHMQNKFSRYLVSLAASQEDPHPAMDGGDAGEKESEEAWKQAVESFKEQASKMQSVSQEAYEEYSKKAAAILHKTSEQLKVQAEKTRNDFSVLAKEVSVEGKEYITLAAENSPEAVKEIVDTYSSSTDDVKEFSQLRDFHVGIPYGFFLSLGGFISFMFTGSTAAVRFGLILGFALLALSVWSLKSYQTGKSSTIASIGQAALASIIFLREVRLLLQGASFFTIFTTFISGIAAVFFLSKIKFNSTQKGSLDTATEHQS